MLSELEARLAIRAHNGNALDRPTAGASAAGEAALVAEGTAAGRTRG